MKMTPKLLEDWIAALESGKYKQTRARLRSDNTECRSEGFCCLGVLCDLVDPCGWEVIPGIGVSYYSHKAQSGHGEYLPDAFGLGPYTEKDSLQKRLARANDDGWSFKDIANFIRAHADEIDMEG